VPLPSRGRVFSHRVLPGLADCAPSGRVRVDALARWLQDVAYADLIDAGLEGHGVWVVRRGRIRVNSFPRFGEEVRLRTFCSGAGRLVAERRTSIDGHGAAVEAVGLWVYLDAASMRPARLDERFTAVYGESAGGRSVRSRLRHPGPPPSASRSRWRFRSADLDVAGHVNNAAYWEIVEERFLGHPEPQITDLEIEYREPAQAGQAEVLTAGESLWVMSEERVHASVMSPGR